MSVSEVPMSRRAFLRGLGVVAALPYLESLAPQVTRAGGRVPVRPPVRFGIFTVTGGTVAESWVPPATGNLGQLPSILRPLQAHRDDLLVLSNLSQSGDSDGRVNAHEHCAYLHLTGADRVGKADGRPFAGISVDQRAAEILGPHSLMPSMRLGYAGGETTFFFDRSGRSLPVERDPRLAFDQMFRGRRLVAPNWARRLGQASAPRANVDAPQTYERQVVDLVLEDARDLQRRLGQTDRAKLQEYLESIDSIERRVRRMQEWIAMEAADRSDPGPSNPRTPRALPADRTSGWFRRSRATPPFMPSICA
jgi:hypothetical protein